MVGGMACGWLCWQPGVNKLKFIIYFRHSFACVLLGTAYGHVVEVFICLFLGNNVQVLPVREEKSYDRMIIPISEHTFPITVILIYFSKSCYRRNIRRPPHPSIYHPPLTFIAADPLNKKNLLRDSYPPTVREFTYCIMSNKNQNENIKSTTAEETTESGPFPFCIQSKSWARRRL